MANLLRSVLIPLIFFSSMISYGQEIETEFHVNVTNLRNNKGHVLISLFRDGKGYPDKPEKAYRIAKLSISNKNASIRFPGLATGNYSIAILHDENDDSKMNTNFFGLPKEGYGFSNNVIGVFGPPSLSRASIQYTSNEKLSIAIRVRY